jgi:hypothetical protein
MAFRRQSLSIEDQRSSFSGVSLHYVTLRPLRRAKSRRRVIFSDLVCSRMRGIFSGVSIAN